MTSNSCIDEFNAKISEDQSELLVVSGNIISDSTVIFSLTRTFSLNEDTIPEDYNQITADIAVVGSDGSRIQGTSKGDGKYHISIGTLDKQVRYNIEIAYEGDVYASEPQYPIETTEIENLTFNQPEDYGDIHICLSTHATSTTTEPLYYIWSYEEDWEIRTVWYSLWVYDPETEGVITYEKAPYAQGWAHHDSDKIIIGSTESYKENLMRNKSIYSFGSGDSRGSFYYSTLLKQRNISKEEFEYYQYKAKLSEDMGGLFTPQPSELPTNISCSNAEKRAIGYVGVNMNVSQRRIYISTEEIQYELPYNCRSYDQDEAGMNAIRAMYEKGYYIATDPPNEQPSGELFPVDDLMYKWTKPECVDYRALGGTSNRPSFWPIPLL